MKIIIDIIQDMDGDDFVAYPEENPHQKGRGKTIESAIGRLILEYKLYLNIEIEATEKVRSSTLIDLY